MGSPKCLVCHFSLAGFKVMGWNSWEFNARVQNEVQRREFHNELTKDAGGLFSILLTVGFYFALLLVTIVFLPITICAPLWTRIFHHPDTIRKHQRNAGFVALSGVVTIGILAALWVFSGYDAIFNSEGKLSFFLTYGLYALIIGLPTILIGYLHLLLTKLNPQFSQGNGYGLLNLHCLLTRIRPSHIFTVLQDVGLLYFFIKKAHEASWEEYPGAFFFLLAFIVTVFIYNWVCDKWYSGRKLLTNSIRTTKGVKATPRPSKKPPHKPGHGLQY